MNKEEIANRTPRQKKMIRIYTIELLVFSVIFITLGVLILVGILGKSTNFRQVFTYITLVGAAILVGDFIWAAVSEKRRKRVSLFDKIIVLPAPIAIVTLDIITLVNGVEAVSELHRYMVGAIFLYIALVYTIQAIYHYFKPLPDLLNEEEEDEEDEAEDKAEEVSGEEAEKAESVEEKEE